MNKIIGIDCDETIVHLSSLWWSYLLANYTLKNEWVYKALDGTTRPYNLTEMFNIPEDSDPFEFWYATDLYDDMIPRPDTLEFIPRIRQLGFKVVFISQTMGLHGQSKTNFINKWFDNDGIIFTKDKHYVKCDVMIDDNPEVLDKFEGDTILIKFRNDYEFKSKCTKPHIVCYDWKSIYNILKENI